MPLRKMVRVSMPVKIIFVSVFLAYLLLFPAPSYSESVDNLSVFISTPEDLAVWLSGNLHYEEIFVVKWERTLQKFLDSKSGNCEDFALLSSELLTRQGIKNEVIVLRFGDLRIHHAICVWKGGDGAYSFMSNDRLYKTDETSLECAVAKFFPDCIKILKYSEVRIVWR